jgi:hypothetical protein
MSVHWSKQSGLRGYGSSIWQRAHAGLIDDNRDQVQQHRRIISTASLRVGVTRLGHLRPVEFDGTTRPRWTGVCVVSQML